MVNVIEHDSGTWQAISLVSKEHTSTLGPLSRLLQVNQTEREKERVKLELGLERCSSFSSLQLVLSELELEFVLEGSNSHSHPRIRVPLFSCFLPALLEVSESAWSAPESHNGAK